MLTALVCRWTRKPSTLLTAMRCWSTYTALSMLCGSSLQRAVPAPARLGSQHPELLGLVASPLIIAPDNADAGGLVPIPLVDLRAGFEEIREDVLSGVRGVLKSMQLLLGPNTVALER